MFVFGMYKMIYSFFFFWYIIFCQYHETKFVCFSSNLRGFELVIFFFAKFVVGLGFEHFYCYVNKLKSHEPNTINLVENGLKNWALVRVSTTGHDRT